MGHTHDHEMQFIDIFEFRPDKSKPGRVLETARIGDVYMSRLMIDPGVTTGNYFHKKTRLMFYVGGGDVQAAFEQVHSGQKMTMKVEYGKQVIHVPPYVALATKNVGHEPAIVIFFSDRPIRDKTDCYAYRVMM